jgi:thiamine-monophosphate kinase
MSALSELGEFGLIARLVQGMSEGPGVALGVGDDAALVETPDSRLLLTVDLLVEGRHFLPTADPVSLGYKALAVNVSDIAAMGGVPRHALLGLSLPANTELAWIDGLRAGLAEAASEYGVTLAGGDTTGGSGVTLSVTLTGTPGGKRVVPRGGAQVGDVICVTNTLGDSYGGLRLTLAARDEGGGVARAAPPPVVKLPPRLPFGEAEAFLLDGS